MIKTAVSKAYNSLVINTVDYLAAPSASSVLNSGCEIWRAYCDIAHPDLEKYIRNKEALSDFEDPDILYHVPIIADRLLSSPLEEMVRAYLGNNVRLDYACFSRISGKADGISSSHWHHDSVGRRLKAFLLLTDNSSQPVISTEYVPHTNRMRLNYQNDLVNGRRIDPQAFHNKSPIRLTGKPGDLIIFDTNGIHRGVYEAQLGFRDTIQLEFSNRTKSRFLRGDVGPRLSKFPKHLQHSCLIDAASSRINNDNVSYG